MITRRNSKGYTLVELMVVVGLTALLSVGVVGMFVTLLRGGGKAAALARVKEEGDFAVITMERLIRNAGSIDPGTCPPPPTVPAPANTIILNDLVDPNVTTTLEKEYATGRLKIIDNIGGSATVRYVTSPDVDIEGDPFTCYPSSGLSGDRVDIDFTVRDDGDQSVAETFSTSVTLRNY